MKHFLALSLTVGIVFNAGADEVKPFGIMFDFAGLTIYKNGKAESDSTRWNLRKDGNRFVYTPNGINKGYKGSIEIARDEHDKIVGVKQTTGTTKTGDKTYYLENGIVKIENGVGTAYTADSCEKMSSMYSELKKCSDLLLDMPSKYELSVNDSKFFPEFANENIVYGRKSKEASTSTYQAGAEIMKIFSNCEEYYNYAGDKKIAESVQERVKEPSVQGTVSK